MQEIPRLMDDHECRKELERIQEHLNAISKDSNTVEVRRNYLISWVTIPSAKIYTPDQLRQIFDLTWKDVEISQLYYMRRKEISQMIKATSQSVCSGITGCQVEILGSGAELLREYRGVTAAMYRSLRGHMPEELAKEVLVSITKEAIKQAEEKR